MLTYSDFSAQDMVHNQLKTRSKYHLVGLSNEKQVSTFVHFLHFSKPNWPTLPIVQWAYIWVGAVVFPKIAGESYSRVEAGFQTNFVQHILSPFAVWQATLDQYWPPGKIMQPNGASQPLFKQLQTNHFLSRWVLLCIAPELMDLQKVYSFVKQDSSAHNYTHTPLP